MLPPSVLRQRAAALREAARHVSLLPHKARLNDEAVALDEEATRIESQEDRSWKPRF